MDGVLIRRFSYLPPHMQHLVYGWGFINNLKRNPLYSLELPPLILSFTLTAIKRSRYCDLIHAHWLLSGFIGLLVKTVTGKPLVITVHGSDVRGTPKAITKFILSRADEVISPHPEITDILADLGLSFTEILNPVDDEKIKSGDPHKVRLEFGLNGYFVVLFLARLDEFKDPLSLITSASAVKNDMRFLIVGDGPLRKQAEDLAKELNVADKVVFTGFRSDIPDILASSDLYVALSPTENIWSVSLVEAMTASKPCVVTKSGRTTDMLKHKQDAYLVDPSNPSEIAKALDELFEDEQLRALLGRNAMVRVSAFSKKSVVSNVIALYNRLLSQAHSRY